MRAFQPLKFENFSILLYNIYTRSGEMGIIPFAHSLPTGEVVSTPGSARDEAARQSVGQGGIK
jgi:hypothetical protein